MLQPNFKEIRICALTSELSSFIKDLTRLPMTQMQDK